MRRRYMVLVAVGVVVAGVGVWLGCSAMDKYYRQPCWEGGSQSFESDRVFQNIDCKVWKAASGELFYAVAFGHDDFEPILPDAFNYKYISDSKEGSSLLINGKRVAYSEDRRLLALDPFGEMQELVLTNTETDIVATGAALAIWQQVVLPRLYSFTGETSGGKRIGHWLCFDKQGRKAYEGEYLDGRRDGKWLYYAGSGKVRAELHYSKGRRDGKWVYYTSDGRVACTLTWHDNIPVERAAKQIGLGHVTVVRPDGTSSGVGT